MFEVGSSYEGCKAKGHASDSPHALTLSIHVNNTLPIHVRTHTRTVIPCPSFLHPYPYRSSLPLTRVSRGVPHRPRDRPQREHDAGLGAVYFAPTAHDGQDYPRV